MVNSVLSRILRSEGTASLGYPIIKQQQAANPEMITNLVRPMPQRDSAFLTALPKTTDGKIQRFILRGGA
jgi:acyl-coenzyme A synthetase/AMP-(fatty) acid ligase